jgi:hypothetical protein
MVFLLLDWHQPCTPEQKNSSNWQPMLGRKAGPAGLGAHLSCIQGLSQSVVLTLNAAKVCALMLDLAGLALAVSVLQLYRPQRKGHS